MRTSRVWLSAMLIGTAAASCSSGGGTAASSSSPSSSSPSSSVSPSSSSVSSSSSSASPQDVLGSVALKLQDLPGNVTLKLIPGGDQVANQVTLDLCGADFPSESLRTDRLQLIAQDASNATVVNNENVLYRTPQGAEQALTELRQAITGCDSSKFAHSRVSGVRDLRYELTVIPDAELAGLSDDHVAFTAKLTAQDGETRTQGLIFQRRGAVLVGIYGASVDPLLPFARLTAMRLAALTPGDARE